MEEEDPPTLWKMPKELLARYDGFFSLVMRWLDIESAVLYLSAHKGLEYTHCTHFLLYDTLPFLGR